MELAQYRDNTRKDYKIYLEPVLNTGCKARGSVLGITKSKYVRYCVIRCLIMDGWPLNKISSKFDEFYKLLNCK